MLTVIMVNSNEYISILFLMVAVTDSRFAIAMNRGTFKDQSAFFADKFCMNVILLYFLGFAVWAFHHHHNIKN